jgi:LysW-gamma-L-lysine carboxypeptidase
MNATHGRFNAGQFTGGGFTPGPVSETQAVGLLRAMLEIPSPSYHESALASYLVTAMRGLGFRAYLDVVGNVVGELDRGPGPSVMLLGHLDTVPGVLPVRSVEGRLYGRGAVDAKGPLATMICAAVNAVDFPGRIVVVGVVEEETPCSRGAMAIRQTLRRPDALVVGEPSGWSGVVLGYKGKLDLRYEVTTPATHPSNPAPKASELAVQSWATLCDLLPPEASHTSFDVPAATLVSVAGDLTSAEMVFSVRTPPGFDGAAFVNALRERLPAGRLTVVNEVPACRTDRRDPIVRALFAGINQLQGRSRALVKTATSDMNTLAEVWDVPMATYGPGDSALDHSDDEHLVLADYQRGIAVLTAALLEFADARATRPDAGAPAGTLTTPAA